MWRAQGFSLGAASHVVISASDRSPRRPIFQVRAFSHRVGGEVKASNCSHQNQSKPGVCWLSPVWVVSVLMCCDRPVLRFTDLIEQEDVQPKNMKIMRRAPSDDKPGPVAAVARSNSSTSPRLAGTSPPGGRPSLPGGNANRGIRRVTSNDVPKTTPQLSPARQQRSHSITGELPGGATPDGLEDGDLQVPCVGQASVLTCSGFRARRRSSFLKSGNRATLVPAPGSSLPPPLPSLAPLLTKQTAPRASWRPLICSQPLRPPSLAVLLLHRYPLATS
jgi:hypothetical protein